MAGEPDAGPLLADRPLIGGKAAAYVCHGYVRNRTESTALIAALR
ncbi:hypothetical protein [Actinophytocola sp.]